jgi:hypothetical protein
MSDALSRNVPKLSAGVEMLLARCLAHGRRQFVEVAQNFPDQCRYVLETLGAVYGYDAEAREHGLSPEKRLRFHQEDSQPPMDELYTGLEAQALEGADVILAGSARAPLGQQSGREKLETGGSSPEKRVVITHPERCASRRLVSEPDSHRRAVRCQLVRPSNRTAAARPGTGGQSRRVDAVELPRDDRAGWSMMNPA